MTESTEPKRKQWKAPQVQTLAVAQPSVLLVCSPDTLIDCFGDGSLCVANPADC